jgi:hypothetical protein
MQRILSVVQSIGLSLTHDMYMTVNAVPWLYPRNCMWASHSLLSAIWQLLLLHLMRVVFSGVSSLTAIIAPWLYQCILYVVHVVSSAVRNLTTIVAQWLYQYISYVVHATFSGISSLTKTVTKAMTMPVYLINCECRFFWQLHDVRHCCVVVQSVSTFYTEWPKSKATKHWFRK